MLLLTPTRVAGVKCLSTSVCVCVCPRDRTKTAETTVTKLATGIVIMSPGCPFNIRSEVKVTGSQSASDQVAGVR